MACASASTSMAMNGAVRLRLEILTISFLICHSGGSYVLMPAGSGHDNTTTTTGRQQAKRGERSLRQLPKHILAGSIALALGLLPQLATAAGLIRDAEIGRASCRERV